MCSAGDRQGTLGHHCPPCVHVLCLLHQHSCLLDAHPWRGCGCEGTHRHGPLCGTFVFNMWSPPVATPPARGYVAPVATHAWFGDRGRVPMLICATQATSARAGLDANSDWCHFLHSGRRTQGDLHGVLHPHGDRIHCSHHLLLLHLRL